MLHQPPVDSSQASGAGADRAGTPNQTTIEEIGMPRRFADESHDGTRALQAYLVLIGLAWTRQTITYGQLSQNQMKYGQGGILADPLGCIMGWCYENGLPPLTALVINGETGLPGGGLYVERPGDLPAAQQKVFGFNSGSGGWYSLFPPDPDELEAAGRRAATGTLRAPN